MGRGAWRKKVLASVFNPMLFALCFVCLTPDPPPAEHLKPQSFLPVYQISPIATYVPPLLPHIEIFLPFEPDPEESSAKKVIAVESPNLQWNGTHICVTISGRINQFQLGAKNGLMR